MTNTGDETWEKLAGKPDARSREIPISSLGGWWAVPNANTPVNHTGTELEALMMSAPGHEVPWDDPEDMDPYAGFDLDEIELAVLDAIVMAGLSYRQAGKLLNMSHTHVRRIYFSIKLRIERQWDDRESDDMA